MRARSASRCVCCGSWGGETGSSLGAGGAGSRINVIGTPTSALLIVIVWSTATCLSRVTRIVYVPGANAIPGAYVWATLRASVTVILLSAGVGSTVRRKVRGGGGGGVRAIRSG